MMMQTNIIQQTRKERKMKKNICSFGSLNGRFKPAWWPKFVRTLERKCKQNGRRLFKVEISDTSIMRENQCR